MSLNIVKTQPLIIGSRPNILKIETQTDAKPSFEIGEQKINMITDTKYLGVQIDDKLQWDRHIEQVKAKALRSQGFCRKCIEELLSHISVVAARFVVVVAKSNSIQNRAARITRNSPYDAPAVPLLQNLGWPSIRNLINSSIFRGTF